MSSSGGSFAHTSFHVGSDFMVRCSDYPDQVPILSLDAGHGSVSITPAGREATDEAVEFARALVRAVHEFAAEIERLHAAKVADAGSSGDQTSRTADGKAA